MTGSPSEIVTKEALEAFFGCTGEDLDPPSPWPYKEVRYSAASEDWSVFASFYPAAPDVRLSIKVAGNLVYELEARQAGGVEVLNDPEHLTLKIVLVAGASLFVRLHPRPSVHQSLELTSN